MLNSRILILFLCILSNGAFLVPAARANPISITDLGVDNAQGRISVGFSIVVNDPAPLRDALQNGGTYEVLCSAKLYRRRMGLWDLFISEAQYACAISSKTIAREFLIEDHRGVHNVDFSELQPALNRFWSRLSLPMGDWGMIERNRAYQVVLTFKINRANVPGWVSKPLFFVNWDLVPETVYVLDFDF